MRKRAGIIRKHLYRLAYLLFLVACFPSAANGQESAATLMGTVQDSTGASIAGAGVKLINMQTGTENDSTTNGEGSFLLPGIIPGSYVLWIERAGFATTQINGIRLNVGDTKSVLIRMKVGSVLESVIVDGSGLSLNTTDAAISTVVDQKFVSSIPLNGRSFQDLISLTPGIVTQNPQAASQGSQTQGEFSVNGQRPESNSFFVDGVSANYSLGLTSGSSRISSNGTNAGSTALGTTQTLVPLDALQEFRVLTSTYSAEYGRTPGGQFTFLTRSGTNAPHGSLYEYWRHYDQDAVDWFLNYERQEPYHQLDSGGTLGMPVDVPRIYNGRDRTFIFLSYENLQLAQQTPPLLLYTVAACPPSIFTSCSLPSALKPVLNTFPGLGVGSGSYDTVGTGLTPIYNPPEKWPASVSSTSIRLDQTFSPKLSLFFRYGSAPSYSRTLQLSSLTTSHANARTFTLGFFDNPEVHAPAGQVAGENKTGRTSSNDENRNIGCMGDRGVHREKFFNSDSSLTSVNARDSNSQSRYRRVPHPLRLLQRVGPLALFHVVHPERSETDDPVRIGSRVSNASAGALFAVEGSEFRP